MSSDARKIAVQEVAHQVIEPILIGAAIGIGKRHDFTGCRGNTGVSGHRRVEAFSCAK